MNRGIPFVHKRSARSRSVRIHVDSSGTVVVTTPMRFATARLPEYVEKARDWIEQRLSESKLKPKLITDSRVYYYGEPHEIVITDKMDGEVRVYDGKILVSPLSNSASAGKLLLEKWLKNRCAQYCIERLEQLAGKMKTSYNGVRFKQQKTCWGSCSSDKNLNFNWRLIHAPKEVIDYVMIHELAHITHMNHSRSFWDLVSKYDPDYPLHRGWLKRFGASTG